MEIANRNIGVLFEWEGTTVYLTQSMLATWIVMGVLILFAVVVRIRLRFFKDVPRGFQNLIEMAVESMSNFARNTMGEGFDGYGGVFFSVFAFILVSNYSSLVGLRPPTSDLATTAALALMVFVIIHFSGIRKMRVRYFKEYLSPSPIFLPINLVGELSKPISLCFRLFGNVLGGVIIMGLVYQLLPLALRFVLPDVLHLYFDIFVGALQAFIFTVLSMTFVQQKSTPQ